MIGKKSVKSFYEDPATVLQYDAKRFGGVGGNYIDQTEKKCLFEAASKLPTGSKVLEVAPGTGRFCIQLAKMGYQLTVIDSSQEMLDIIATKASEEDVGIECLCQDAAHLNFANDSFDMVFALRFLWHYKEYDHFLKEMVRVLKPGGVLLVDFHNIYSLRLLIHPIANLFVKSILLPAARAHDSIRNTAVDILETKWRFFFPYLLYRKMPSVVVRILIIIEQFMSRIGVTKRCGSVFYITGRKRDEHATT